MADANIVSFKVSCTICARVAKYLEELLSLLVKNAQSGA
jgi:hypothetical protein